MPTDNLSQIDLALTIGTVSDPAPHFILYGLPDGTAHRATGNLGDGIPIPAGARLLELGPNEPATTLTMTIGHAKA